MTLFGKVKEDGFLIRGSGNIIPDGFIPLENFEKDTDGNYYKFYNTIAVDGMYQADTATIALIEAQAIEDAKPKSVSRVQAMKAMKQTGTLWTDFNTLLASNQDAKDEWDLATELQRNHDLTLSMSVALSLTSTELDDLFLLASTL